MTALKLFSEYWVTNFFWEAIRNKVSLQGSEIAFIKEASLN